MSRHQISKAISELRSDGSRRLPRTRDEAREVRIQPHDIEVLRELLGSRLMSRQQLVDLGYWNSVSRANARLRRLFDASLVSRRFPPSTMVTSGEALYFLGPQGINVIAETLDLDTSSVRRLARTSTSPQFIAHTLAIVNLKIAATIDARSKQMNITWLPELRVRHEFKTRISPNLPWVTTIVRPDAYLNTSCTQGTPVHGFIECDMASESADIIKHKLSAYCLYQQTVFSTTYKAKNFLVLFVVPGRRRRDLIISIAKSAEAMMTRCSTLNDIRESGFFGKHWHRPNSALPSSLLEEELR